MQVSLKSRSKKSWQVQIPSKTDQFYARKRNLHIALANRDIHYGAYIVSSDFTSQYSKITDEVIAVFRNCPYAQKKVVLLRFIEIMETTLKKQNVKISYLEKITEIKKAVKNAGVVQVNSNGFGESQLISLFNVGRQAIVAKIKQVRRRILVALFILYLIVFLATFFSTFPIPMKALSLVTLSAEVAISLLLATSYNLLFSLCEAIFKPLNKFGIRYKLIQYNFSTLISFILLSAFININYSYLRSSFTLPSLLPFLVKLIEGVSNLNLGLLLSSIGGIITYVVTTLVSIFTLWKFISDILEKRRRDKSLNLVSKIDKETLE